MTKIRIKEQKHEKSAMKKGQKRSEQTKKVRLENPGRTLRRNNRIKIVFPV